ncbi:hypothetical protein LTR17_025564 [Elasticomyces elasticus]|nr:hypothetical protein LTR17_025564 [Elasticomyces elasticus]
MGPRNSVLLAELKAGHPACTPLGEDYYTSDFQVSQPLGSWDFSDLNSIIHIGPYLPPVHNAGTSGYSYLALFDDRYEALAEARLGRRPRTRALRELCAKHQNFLSHGKFRGVIKQQGEMWRVRIECADEGGGVAASRMLDMLPTHRTFVG